MSGIDRDAINSVLMGVEDPKIRYLFVERHSEQLEAFVDHMVESFQDWKKLDTCASKNEPGAHVSALVYGALHSHVVSMKLLLCGLLVAAGNTQRYVLESIATALLVSKPSLGVLAKYAEGKYSTSNAVRDVIRHHKTLELNREALETLERSSRFYDKYSHPTLLSLTSIIALAGPEPAIVLGGCYDDAKAPGYRKEITSRVSLASTFPNLIYGVYRNYRVEA